MRERKRDVFKGFKSEKYRIGEKQREKEKDVFEELNWEKEKEMYLKGLNQRNIG